MWEMSGDKDGLLYWPKLSLDHSSTSFASWLGLLNRGSLRAQSPQSPAGSHFGNLSPTDSNSPGTWFYYFLTSTCFRCSSAYLHRCISWLTEVGRGSIYNTYANKTLMNCKVTIICKTDKRIRHLIFREKKHHFQSSVKEVIYLTDYYMN